MDEAMLRQQITHILETAGRLPAPEGADADTEFTGPGRRMATLEDSLNRLRLAIKYLVFDLEATKRENRILRNMLA